VSRDALGLAKPLSSQSSAEDGEPRKVSGLIQATPAPVLSELALGVVSHTAIRQATQSVMKNIARKTTKLVYPPHSRRMPLQTCVSLCVIVSLQAWARAKKMPRFEAGLRRVSQHGSFLPRRQDNPRKPPRFPLRSGSKPTVTLTLNSINPLLCPRCGSTN
jgi:hypothetical protein